jgi:branched-chain amino acid transport system substrate-binding protein
LLVPGWLLLLSADCIQITAGITGEEDAMRRFNALLLAAMFFAASCGEDDGGGTEEDSSVKIGVLNPTTGDLSLFGEQSNQGIRLYFESVDNRAGDVDVELTFADTGGDPDQALEQARRLVDREEVDMLMGIVNSAVVVPIAQFAGQRELPLLISIGGAQVATGDERNEFVFRSALANGQQERPLGWYAASELGVSRAATLAWDFLVGEERVRAFTETFTTSGGEITAQESPPLGTTDYGPFVSSLGADATDAIYFFFAGPGAIAFLQQLNQFGILPGPQLLADDYATAGVLGEMGRDAEGLVQAVGYVPSLDNAENQSFLEALGEEGVPGAYVEEGYLSAMVAAAAVESAGSGDADALVESLSGLEINTPSGPLRLDENGQAVRNIYITEVVIRNGEAQQEIMSTIEDVGQDWTSPES